MPKRTSPVTAPGAPYKAYKDLLWSEVRRRFLAGETGPALCAEYGLSRSTLADRAKKEGWRRKDQPDEPLPADPGHAAQVLMNRAVLAASLGDVRQAEDLAKASRTFRVEQEKSTAMFAAGACCPHCGKVLGEPVDEHEEERIRLEFKVRILRIRRAERAANRARIEADPSYARRRGPDEDPYLYGEGGWDARDPLEVGWEDAVAEIEKGGGWVPDGI